MLKIWYVSPQRLCNFDCVYCVSRGAYAKSNSVDWRSTDELDAFRRTVGWMGSLDHDIGVRLATLGEPFVSRPFLSEAAWLTLQPNVRFVELLTNGSVLKARLPRLAADGDISKVSLWITYHHAQTDLERVIDSARYAQDEYGCFVVLNALCFQDNIEQVHRFTEAAGRAKLRYNLDVGYDPITPADPEARSTHIPLIRRSKGPELALDAGVRGDVLSVNLRALDAPFGEDCGAGFDYIYIGIEGDVYRCSRYYVLRKEPLGNVLDPGFRLELRRERWARCMATCGCCNKEDFLNLRRWGRQVGVSPSLGWVGSTTTTSQSTQEA